MLLLISVLLKINFPIVIAESLYVLANFISSSKLSLILFGSSSKNNSNLLSLFKGSLNLDNALPEKSFLFRIDNTVLPIL